MKLEIYCDSGANIDSCRKEVIDLSDLGFTEEEWAGMSEQEKEDEVKPIALEKLEWGWREL